MKDFVVTFVVTIKKITIGKIKVKGLFWAFPSLRSGRAFQPSLTLILSLHFVPLQNFGLPCPNVAVCV